MKKKEVFLVIVKFIVKYVVPAFLGYLEGDSHAVQDALLCMIS